MSGRSKRDQQPPQRRASFRPPRYRVLVLCGGQVSEPEYFEGLKAWARNDALATTVGGRRSGPARLVEQAIESSADYDEFWCVTDVDQFPDLAEATRVSGAHGVNLAVSNPCFEAWLLLHFETCTAWIKDCNTATRLLRRHIPAYQKSVDFRLLAEGLGIAIERARRLASNAAEPCPNPSSGVWKLAEKIMKHSAEQK